MSPWRTVRGRQLGVGALILAALATGRAVTTALPVDTTIDDPFVRPGSVGTTVDLRYASVVADAPEGATQLDAAGALLATTGVWVVVPLTITAHGEPIRLGYAAVRDSEGRLYRADGTRSQFAPGVAQPGIARHASVAVEIPADAAAGAHLLLALDPNDQRRDDLADIDLGITAAQVARWAAASSPIELAVASSSDEDRA